MNIYLIVANNTIAVELRNRLVQKDEYQESVVKDKRTILAELCRNLDELVVNNGSILGIRLLRSKLQQSLNHARQ